VIELGVVLGSTRPVRKGKAVADWVMAEASGRDDAKFELIDLADYPLPHFDEPHQPAQNRYTLQHSREWSKVIDRFDGYVFITPEYNHGVPGVLKNAIDFLYREWNDKAAGLVGYGAVGGARAMEQMRLITSGVEMATVRTSVALSVFTEFEDFVRFAPSERAHNALHAMLDRVVAWSAALRSARRPV
jgi:NAD(P)H-dependent FMN reductase